jgi:AraC-like DNA-binding protein
MSASVTDTGVAGLCRSLADDIARYTKDGGDGIHSTAVPGLSFFRESEPGRSAGAVADPLLAIVIQGRKEVMVGDETYISAAGQHMVITVDLPVCVYLSEATPEKPYLGIKMVLDRTLLCDLLPMMPALDPAGSRRAIALSAPDPYLLEAVLRLVRLLATPRDIPALAPLIVREIHYRLMTGDQAGALHQISAGGSAAQRIAEVIRRLRQDFTQAINVTELARAAHMSPSAFHQHFKQITSLSPLQYQKQLRLVEARRLMLTEGVRAEHAAFTVGYESASQFSREYGRLFGAPPLSDVSRLRKSGGVAADAV